MEAASFIAVLMGFPMIVIGLSLLINPNRFKNVLHTLEHESTMFMAGIAKLVTGTGILLFYSAWNSSWQTIITVLGWLSVLMGLKMVLAPAWEAKMLHKLEESMHISWLPIIPVILGCVLVYFGFSA